MRQSMATTATAKAIDIPPTENRSRSDIGSALAAVIFDARGERGSLRFRV